MKLKSSVARQFIIQPVLILLITLYMYVHNNAHAAHAAQHPAHHRTTTNQPPKYTFYCTFYTYFDKIELMG